LILTGEYAPGARLPQRHLAKRLGVAQSVVRESLLELRGVGLVEIRDGLGVFVCRVDSNLLLQAHEVRAVLEGLAVRLCCEHISRGELLELRQRVERMRSLEAEGSHGQYAALDRQYHLRLTRISRNGVLIRLTDNYRVLTKMVRVRRRSPTVDDEHWAILDAIAANRPDEAERLMVEHIRAGTERFRQETMEHGGILRWIDDEADGGDGRSWRSTTTETEASSVPAEARRDTQDVAPRGKER